MTFTNNYEERTLLETYYDTFNVKQPLLTNLSQTSLQANIVTHLGVDHLINEEDRLRLRNVNV